MEELVRTINLRCKNPHEVVLIEKLAARMGVTPSVAVERVCADAVRDALLLSGREPAKTGKKEARRRAV